MSERRRLWRGGWGTVLLLAGLTMAGSALPAAAAGGPVDAPAVVEPRIPLARCLSFPGLMSSEGTHQPFLRVRKGETLHTRDLLVALPGFKIDVETLARGARLTLWGNLPGLSDSPVLESAVVLHDSTVYDLDFTLLRGRVVLTNTKAKGAAKFWVRREMAAVEVILPNPGDSVAAETYGRWARGVPFSLKATEAPINLWEVFCLNGKAEIKAGKLSWNMAAPPGPAYFHGNSLDGPATAGPERLERLPDWADSKAPVRPLARLFKEVVGQFTGKLEKKDPDEVVSLMLGLAAALKDRPRATLIRQMIVTSMAALDAVDHVVELLEQSSNAEVRAAAVLALRHWIGANRGRDRLLYELLDGPLGYSKSESEAILQLLHSPFDPKQAETYETLITYLNHRKQAVRELAHWHLVRLVPDGRDIPFDAAAAMDQRRASAAAWKKLVPSGELPKEKPDDTKKGSDD